jgi:hypothetical protein
MAIIATETMHYSALIKREHEPEWGYCKKVITLNGPAATLPIGSVLGLVTATGKYKLTETSATDGSQNPSVVVVGDAFGRPVSTVVPATTDTKFLVVYRGPCGVADQALTFGASVTAGAVRNTAMAALTTNSGIDVLTQI